MKNLKKRFRLFLFGKRSVKWYDLVTVLGACLLVAFTTIYGLIFLFESAGISGVLMPFLILFILSAIFSYRNLTKEMENEDEETDLGSGPVQPDLPLDRRI